MKKTIIAAATFAMLAITPAAPAYASLADDRASVASAIDTRITELRNQISAGVSPFMARQLRVRTYQLIALKRCVGRYNLVRLKRLNDYFSLDVSFS